MQREPHQNVATVLVDPAVLRDLELDLMARDLWLWPVATAPVCLDGPRQAFQIRRRLIEARPGVPGTTPPAGSRSGSPSATPGTTAPSRSRGAAHQALWSVLAAFDGHVHHARRLGGVPRLDLPHDRVPPSSSPLGR